MDQSYQRKAMATAIEARCHAKGLRLTGHGRLIARVISEGKDYPDFPELYRRVSERNSRVSRATVCRTLTLLTREGIIERHTFGGERFRYAAASGSFHDHLIDLKNGKVLKFANKEIQLLLEKIARDLGFKLVGHRLELYATPLRASGRPHAV